MGQFPWNVDEYVHPKRSRWLLCNVRLDRTSHWFVCCGIPLENNENCTAVVQSPASFEKTMKLRFGAGHGKGDFVVMRFGLGLDNEKGDIVLIGDLG